MQQPDGTMKRLSAHDAEVLKEFMADKMTPEERTLTPLFQVGELLEIRGGKFRIVALGTKYMRLQGVPWSTVE